MNEVKWMRELEDKYNSEALHTFLLFLNTSDDVLIPESDFKRLHQYLATHPFIRDAEFILFYNRGSGIRFAKPEMREKLFKVLGFDDDQKKEFKLRHREPKYALFDIFDPLLSLSRKHSEYINVVGEDEAKKNKDKLFAVCILEYVETIVPQGDPASLSQPDRDLIVLLEWWAQNRDIHKNKNLIILESQSLGAVSSPLREPTCGVMPLMIRFPNLNQRFEGLEVLRKSIPALEGDVGNEELSHLTSGLSHNAIAHIVKEAHYHGIPLEPDHVFAVKKKILEEQSGGMIEIVKPLWGMDAIGGLEAHKDYIRGIVRAMREKDLLSVPMGVLLVGAPGTGKTVFAEATAYEADIPLVILKNLREMWVGQSERNLDLVLELIKEMAPVIVFMDEIDQQIQRRGEVFHGDSGVSARMAARQFAFMSDTSLRGQVVWLAATNRPDLLDQAILRAGRFDETIPFLPPDVEERVSIYRALLRKMEIKAESARAEFHYQLSDDELRELAELSRGWLKKEEKKRARLFKARLDPYDKEEDFDEVDYTGAEIEVLLLKAYRRARRSGAKALEAVHLRETLRDFIPTRDFMAYEFMNKLAIRQTDSLSFLPEKWRELAKQFRTETFQPLIF